MLLGRRERQRSAHVLQRICIGEKQRNISGGAAEHAFPLTRRSTDPKTCTSRTAF
jgi:hypothetical protein